MNSGSLRRRIPSRGAREEVGRGERAGQLTSRSQGLRPAGSESGTRDNGARKDRDQCNEESDLDKARSWRWTRRGRGPETPENVSSI